MRASHNGHTATAQALIAAAKVDLNLQDKVGERRVRVRVS